MGVCLRVVEIVRIGSRRARPNARKHPRRRIFSALDGDGTLVRLHVLDQMDALVSKVPKEDSFSTALQEQQGIERVEDGHGGLMDRGDDGDARVGDPPQTPHHNARRAGIQSRGGFVCHSQSR